MKDKSPSFAALVGLFITAFAFADEGDVFDRLDKNSDGQLQVGEIDSEDERLFRRLLRLGDADEDGQISKEEFVAETTRDVRDVAPTGGRSSAFANRPQFSLEQLLTRLDRNKDSKLSKDETPERMRENFARIDQNSDGFIDGQELRRIGEAMRSRGGNDPSRSPQGNPQFATMAARVFKERDTNEDGRISIDEVPQQRRAGFRRLLERHDVDPEVGLTQEQFTKAMAQFTPQRRQAPAGGGLAQRLKEADANEDGKLSRDELPQQLRPLFDRWDGNSDGLLDEAELRRLGNRRPQ